MHCSTFGSLLDVFKSHPVLAFVAWGSLGMTRLDWICFVISRGRKTQGQNLYAPCMQLLIIRVWARN